MFELDGVKFNWVPNQIDAEYWKRPEVREWAEPIMEGFAKNMDWTKKTKSYGDKFATMTDPKYIKAAALLFRDTFFEMDAVRTEAFLIAVKTHGLNPDASGYNDLWIRQPAKQEAA